MAAMLHEAAGRRSRSGSKVKRWAMMGYEEGMTFLRHAATEMWASISRYCFMRHAEDLTHVYSGSSRDSAAMRVSWRGAVA